MGLFLVLVVLSAIQHGLTQDVSSLPRLRDNKLDVGADTSPSNGTYIDCGREGMFTGKLRSLTLREALTTENFKDRPFTSVLISSRESLQISRKEARFKMVEIRTWRYLYALQVDPSGEKAFWLNQSIHMEEPYPYVDIPVNPTADKPKYVFTPDFSGCSWTVTPLGNGFLRLRHVAHPGRQFNDLPQDQKGGSISYAMQYLDYGFPVQAVGFEETVHSFAYMHYSGGRWTLHLQCKACCPSIGEKQFSNHMLSSVTLRHAVDMVYFRNPIPSTVDYAVPVV